MAAPRSHAILSAAIAWALTGMITPSMSAEPPERAGWKLIFHDGFDGEKLDTEKWTPADPWGKSRNNELQAYVPEAIQLQDGTLRIGANRGEAEYDGQRRSYTSGIVTTYKKFTFSQGLAEVRCRVPSGRGLWPAVWLLPEPLGWPPEIDLFELLGHEPTKVHMTHHWRDLGKVRSHTESWTGPDFSKDFHTFAIDWDATRIAWSVDGAERFRSRQNIPTAEMYLLMNLAVGGDWPGAPADTTQFPAYLEIDYISVYQRAK